MRSYSTRLQCDTDKILVRYQRHLREGQLFRNQNRRFREGALAFLLPKMAQHTMADIPEVGRPLA